MGFIRNNINLLKAGQILKFPMSVKSSTFDSNQCRRKLRDKMKLGVVTGP